MIGADAKVIGKRRVWVGEPVQPPKLGRQIRVYLTTPAEQRRRDAMWAAVVAFSEGGGCLPSPEPEKRTSDSLIESCGHSTEIVWRPKIYPKPEWCAPLQDEQPVISQEQHSYANAIEALKVNNEWLDEIRDEHTRVMREASAELVALENELGELLGGKLIDPRPMLATNPSAEVEFGALPEKPVYGVSDHAITCAYHADQYPWECDCGASACRK